MLIFLCFGAMEHFPVSVVLDDLVRGAIFLTVLSHYRIHSARIARATPAQRWPGQPT